MCEPVKLTFNVDGTNFSAAGDASMQLKKELRALGFSPITIRKASIAMYEGEINMVIHAGGGKAFIYITPEEIRIVLEDQGPGIPDVDKAMAEGFSTATEEIRNIGFGAGMGLPNMKKNSDTFKIDSVAGKGTTVSMTVKAV